MTAEKYLQIWKTKVTDKELLDEINAINGVIDIEDRFNGYLQFGTAGLRGILGAGTRYINRYTVAKATLGIIDYLKQNFNNSSVVIAYDNRRHSKRFAQLVARLLLANDIKAYLFDTLTPTPVLSFAVQKFGATLGINITSSHNPKEYNGYKVVNSKGCQISTEEANEITKLIEIADEFSVDYDKLKMKKIENVIRLGKEVTDNFLEISNKMLNYKSVNNLQVIFTPLNGAGYYAITKLLDNLGFSFKCPISQIEPDENFTTCKNPNPELFESFGESLKLAQSFPADIIVASDPDADRVGVVVKHDNKYTQLTGDEVGILLLNYIIEQKKSTNTLVKNSFAVTSVVSSVLTNVICDHNQVTCQRVLTGFKNLGETTNKNIKTYGKDAFILTYEESCGYLVSTHLCDKDAITPTALIAIIADKLKANNKTLIDYLNEIFERYGYIINKNVSTTYKGSKGSTMIKGIISALRNKDIKNIGGFKVINKIDYLNDNTGLEPSNFIEFNLNNGCKVIVRPSGTEPKLKIYYSSYHIEKSICKSNMDKLVTGVEQLFKEI